MLTLYDLTRILQVPVTLVLTWIRSKMLTAEMLDATVEPLGLISESLTLSKAL